MSAYRSALATAAWAAVHSALAADPAKRLATRALGERRRNGLYRPIYNVIAIVTFAALVAYVRRQPRRDLYRVRGPLAAAMRLGQLAALGYAAWAAWEVGPLRFAGLPGLWALLRGRAHVPREPEAQGPPLDDRTGQIRAAGPFRTSRQPLNFVLIPLMWLNPRMTTRFAACAVVTTVYAYVGSLHSERRLKQRYGAGYVAYSGAGTPFFLPLFQHDTAPPNSFCSCASPVEW